jgi:hypothetical protein
MHRLEEVCEALGFPREDGGRARRRPVPHVTLARLNGVNTGTNTGMNTGMNTGTNTSTRPTTKTETNTNTIASTSTSTNTGTNPATSSEPGTVGAGVPTVRGTGHQHETDQWITRTQRARGWYGRVNGGEIVLFESRFGDGERYVPLGRVLLGGHGGDGRGSHERTRDGLHDERLHEERLHEERLHEERLHEEQHHGEQLHEEQSPDERTHEEQLHDERVDVRAEEIVDEDDHPRDAERRDGRD